MTASLKADRGSAPTMSNTVAEIEAYADAAGIDLSGASNKAQRIAAIEAALGGLEDGNSET